MKRLAAMLAAVLLSASTSVASVARTAHGTLTVQVAGRAAGPRNTMTVSDASGRGETDYPLQFGRPFLEGAIPSGQLPQVLVNGAAIATQADVKNRYPNGSVEFAVIAAVIPRIPANGSVTLSFQPTGGDRKTPLSAAQMLDASYNFDAADTLVGGTPAVPLAPAVLKGTACLRTMPFPCTVAGFQTVTNGGFDITINGVLAHVTGIDFSTLASDWSNFDALIAPHLPATVTMADKGSSVRTLTTIAQGAAATLSYASAPTGGGTDLSAVLGFAQGGSQTSLTRGTNARAANPVTGAASARAMLQNGDYKLWTSGPIAQTIILADDTPARKYDIGFGDGYHPFRPRFEATFWPQTHQVYVRAIGENGLSSEIEDLRYRLTLTGGARSPATEESLASLAQPALTTWTKTFWLGGTPNPQVNIDNNLAYLDSTRFIPNYDPSIAIPAATIANDYARWWTNTSHDIGGSGAWAPGMENTGARPDIAPEPSWDVAWLYSGDWRVRQTALGNADLAGWWSVNVRELDPTTRLNRSDPAPVPPAVGTGYGRALSITDHIYLGPTAQGLGVLLYNYSGNRNAPHKLGVVGPVYVSPSASNLAGWQYEQAHIPSPFFVPYILTGDPWYLNEIEMWAAYDAATNLGGPGCGTYLCRGPTGDEGGAQYELRGSGWLLRSRAEAAFAIPDADPFKTYLRILTQEDIARWEGALGVADPVLGSYAEYTWAQQTGDPHSDTQFGTPAPAPALRNWETVYIGGRDTTIQGEAVNATGETEPWMQWFVQYAIGRATELGFAAAPLTLSSGQYLIGMINSTGYPQLISSYFLPTWTSAGQITSWSQFVANLQTPWLTGSGYTGGQSQGALPQQFAAALWSNGYDMYAVGAMAPLVDQGAPGAAQAEAWLKANVYQPLIANNGIVNDPTWAIVPRTDKNTLPAQPTSPR